MDSQVFQKDQDENAWEINDGFKFKRFGNKKLAETTNIRKTISWQSEATNLTNNTSFPVIVQETPIINRNRELRNAKRRSSLELRGKRVSVLNGVAGTPHESIDPAQYYRHIDADQPDAIRMRQLLIWACEKVINSYSYVDSNPEVVLQGTFKVI